MGCVFVVLKYLENRIKLLGDMCKIGV